MAGIGFTLERMTCGRSLSSTIGAYIYAAFLVAGPWIFTVISIGGMSLATCSSEDCPDLQVFRSVIIYNSFVCAILSSPIAFVCTRFVSDQIWMKRYESVTFAFVAGLVLFSVCALALAMPFYAFATTLTGIEVLSALQNLMLMGAAWLLIPFLGALRSHVAVTFAFGLGSGVMIGSILLAPAAEPVHLLFAFNAGLCLIDFILTWCLVREYGLRLVPDPALLRTALTYWELPLIGLTYALGLWIDKLVMWTSSPVGIVRVAGALDTMPNYDTPMFWAQLAAIPILAVFFVHVETNFFRLCREFYGSLANHVSRRQLMLMMSRLYRFVMAKLFGLFVALTAIGLIAILTSFVAIEPLGLRASQMGILRVALTGMVFQTSAMFCFVFLLYFDLKRQALLISLTYLVTNGGFTAALLPLGFPFFGYGNMLASATTFLVALLVLGRELPWLHFHVFVTNNTSLHPAAVAVRPRPRALGLRLRRPRAAQRPGSA
ncbi:exopolysaccharide Pel transporter PelG [Methylobacterium soli]|uniref:Exopolysaccharide Pel transporter PelG n=1 Tax=Methylobacterium soli TaxID=553447 RepID=A0A6L3T132_9HYPH|nr:exopolysaccharide Pel transporter PelG [Methylobacterium soli]KAB1080272.1 hypothetical protein F6X53_06100 [Methylobacterium soli]GJE42606.1 hypothetical protein AEGHOMDF_1778 [Methylobacterium soli]